jgi:hypothetical protein
MAETGFEGYGGNWSCPLELTSIATCKWSALDQYSASGIILKEDSPPPNGVFGCGESTIAIPGVNICPLTICCAFRHLADRAAATMNPNSIAFSSSY